MMGRYMLILFAFLVEGVFSDAAEVKSVTKGDPVILNSGVTKHQHDMMRWYFNNTLIALINGDPRETCLYDGPDGRFRDRLMLDCKTGSLIITNSRPEHTGDYEAKFRKGDNSGTVIKLDRNITCYSTKIITKDDNPDKTIKSVSLTVSGLCPDVVAVIVGVVLLLAAVVIVVGGIYLHRRRSRNDLKKKKLVSNDESPLQKQNGKP